MKATLALQQSGLKSVCVGSTWPWKKRIKTLLDCSMQNIEIFHFVVLESVLERSLMVSSLCSQCVAALQGKDKLGTSEDAEEIPALNGGEMSPVLRSQYQTGVYHGLTYKSHDQVKKCTSLPFLFFMTLSHVDCSFFLKFLLERFWLWVFLVNRILWYLWLKVKSVHSGWNTSSLEENGVGTSHGWGCVALNHRAMWISLLPVWGLELLDRTMYRLRALHSSEAASYVISNTFNAHQQGGTACFHFFVFANLLCGMFP